MLHYGELEDVLDNYCELGMYDPKSGSDEEIIVLNLFYSEESAGRDLKQFIEYMPVELVDVSVRDNLHEDYYKLFIEIEKNSKLFETVCRVLRDCAGLGNIEEWRIKLYRKDETTISVEDMEKVIGDTKPKLEEPKDESSD